ncbi:MAG TPA: capsule assembly Wzi family protein, partial [Aggregatilineaceae bacterium]|nr:capsule assembly Wzi family protein [Aggregatilineaceae bacterium]
SQPGAVYAQIIGEDEAGGLPSKLFGLGGIETWGAWQDTGASWRAFLEVANTRTGLLSDHTYNITYNHGIYRSGYRYRDRSLGHGADNDSTILTLGLLLSDRQEHGWQLTGRSAEFNRDDSGLNPFSPRHEKYRSLELRHQRPFYSGLITVDVGVHHTRLVAEGTSNTDPSLALSWQRNY